jgi:hypothetical protein
MNVGAISGVSAGDVHREVAKNMAYTGGLHGSKWRRRFAALPFILLLTSVSCVYDADDRCGENQVYEDGHCACAAGFGLYEQECRSCEENEVGNPTGPCECEDGLVRAGEGEPCIEAVGMTCSVDDDCTNSEFSHCQLEDDSGYCTKADCTAGGDDCPGSYACNDRSDPAFCERPPTGLGTACSSNEDCAEFEAAYCESITQQACVVEGCAADPAICHGDWVCCDITIIDASFCTPPEELENGECPGGGTLVPR